MKTIFYFMVLIFLLSSCNKFDRIFNRNPHLELSRDTPYDLEVTDFSWGYGMTEINKLDGDFDLLDQRVYDLLKGKSGLCKLYFKSKQSNQYGDESLSNIYIGEIDIDDLNKYHDWEYWHKSAGVSKLIYNNIVNKRDSTKIDKVPINTAIAPVQPSHEVIENSTSTVTPKVFGFEEEDLYPSTVGRVSMDSTLYVIDGTIDQVDLETGIIHLIVDGSFYTVLFNPKSPSVNVRNRLAHALKKGNFFKSVCGPNSQNTLQLVKVQITEK